MYEDGNLMAPVISTRNFKPGTSGCWRKHTACFCRTENGQAEDFDLILSRKQTSSI